MLPNPDPVLVLVAAFGIGLIFAGAAVAKLADLQSFIGVVQNFRLLPYVLVKPFAVLLPILELAVAGGLAFPATRSYAAIGTLALLVVFTAAIAVNLARGRRSIDCGCFGDTLKQPLSGWLIARNAVLGLLAVTAAAPGFPGRPLHWLDLMTGIGGALSLLLLYLILGHLLAAADRVRRKGV
jgi:hypothetical protein